MRSQWGSQSERWRFAMRHSAAGSEAERLAAAIGGEIREGLLPRVAVLPTTRRLAVDLMVDESVVCCAYEQLQRAGLIATRSDQRVCVVGGPERAHEALPSGATIVPFSGGRRSNKNTGQDD
jgi:DNA-binding transcriptional MocR family regulator